MNTKLKSELYVGNKALVRSEVKSSVQASTGLVKKEESRNELTTHTTPK